MAGPTITHLHAAAKAVNKAVATWENNKSASETKKHVDDAIRRLQEADWLLQVHIGD